MRRRRNIRGGVNGTREEAGGRIRERRKRRNKIRNCGRKYKRRKSKRSQWEKGKVHESEE